MILNSSFKPKLWSVVSSFTFILGLIPANSPAMTSTNWMDYRGDPSNTGASPETLSMPLRIRWQKSLNGAVGNVVVYNSIVYAVSAPLPSGSLTITAVDLATGTNIWTVTSATSGNAKAQVATDGQRLFVSGPTASGLTSYNLSDGSVSWTNTSAGWMQQPLSVNNGVLYAASATSGILAIDPVTGVSLWQNTLAGNNYFKTAPVHIGPDIFFGAGYSWKWYSATAATGAVNFSVGASPMSMSPAYAGGKLFGLVEGGTLYALNTSNLSTAWSKSVPSARYCSPAVAGTNVYIASETGKTFYSLNQADGSTAWSTLLSGQVWGCGVTVAGGYAFVADDSSHIYAIDRTTGAIAWSTTLTGTTGMYVYQEPVPVNGALIMGDDAGGLIAFEHYAAAAPQLNCSLSAGFTVLYAGDRAEIYLTVTNTGGANATAVTPTLSVISGGILVSTPGASTPAGPVTITAGNTTVFKWTLSCKSAGTVVLESAMSGGASCTSNQVTLGISAPAPTTWPQFSRDMAHNGSASDALIGPFCPRWVRATGAAVLGAPIVHNGKVYFTNWPTTVRAVDMLSGADVWTATFPSGNMTQVQTDGGRLYVSSETLLRAYDLETGTLIWTNTDAGSSGAGSTFANGLVYAPTSNGPGFGLCAVNAASGRTVWKFTLGGYVKSTPAVAGGTVFIGSADGNFYARNAETGALIWSAPAGAYVSSTQAVKNGRVFGLSETGIMYAFNASTGAVLWSHNLGSARYCSPAVTGGKVFIATENTRQMVAVSETTGAFLWSATLTGVTFGSSVVTANGLVFVADRDGRFYAVDSTSGTISWSATLAGTVGAFMHMATAIGNNIIFQGDDSGRMWAFEHCSVPYAQLDCSMAVSPATADPGDIVSAVLTVTNIGTADANGVAPSITVPTGAARVTMLSGPVPAGPVTLAPAGQQKFTWTYSATGAGAAVFSGSVLATDGYSSATLSCSGSSGSLTINTVIPGAISCNLTTAPAVVLLGEPVSVSLTVKNTGGKTVTGIIPSMVAGITDVLVSSPCGLMPVNSGNEQRITGPSDPGPFSLAPGVEKTITWTYTVAGAWPNWWMIFTSSITGTDSLTGNTLLCCDTSTITLPPPARLACSLAVTPAQCAIGDQLTVSVKLTNTGSSALTGVLPTLTTVTGAEFITLSGAADGAHTLAVGETRTWTWSFRGVKSGQVSFKTSSTGTAGADTASCESTGSAEITMAVMDGKVKIVGGIRGYINPKKGEQANILIKCESAGTISVDIYDMRGRLIRHMSASTAGGRTESIKWDGKDSSGSDVAAGAYPIHITGPGGIDYRDRLAVMR